MASSLRKNVEDQVTCAICHERYTDPRLLPCLHTYCKQCLEDLVKASQNKKQIQMITCPECREVVQVGPEGINQFKVHFHMNHLMSLLTISSSEQDGAGRSDLSCENCTNDEAAQGRCVDCCKFMCDFCLKAHKRFRETQNHRLLTLEELKKGGAPAMTQQIQCEKHKGEVKKLFCESCQQLICRDCTIVDHRQHQYQFIDSVADKYISYLKSVIKEATNKRERIQTSLNSIKTTKKAIQANCEQRKNDIDQAINQKIQILEEQRKILQKQVNTITSTKIKNIEKQKNGHSTKLTCITSTIEFAENALESENNVNILSVSPQASSRLRSLIDEVFNDQPCESNTLVFQDSQQSFKELVTPLMSVFDNNLYYSLRDNGMGEYIARAENTLSFNSGLGLGTPMCYGQQQQFVGSVHSYQHFAFH